MTPQPELNPVLRELSQGQLRWQEVLELMPVPALLIELGSARVIRANRLADEMAGDAFPKELPGDPMPWVGLARGEQVSGLPMEWRLPSGTQFILASGHGLPPMPGRPDMGLVTLQDVTALRRIEESQRDMARELSEKVQELTRSNEDLQQFAYVASHDLQEPLRAVSSYAQLLARRYSGRLDSDADEFLKFIMDGARRMSALVQDLLAYSRVVSRNGDRPEEAVDTDGVVAMATANLSVAIRDNNATVTRAKLPVVSGDHGQLLQVFQNLIGNAIKYHGPEPPRVHIHARRSGETWVFSVEDNGIGIAPEHAERVFLPFKRLHGKEYPGSGVGLAISRKIVERHGGRIWVESEPGQGATFRFTLPAEDRGIGRSDDPMIG